jgi:hypothetical protein
MNIPAITYTITAVPGADPFEAFVLLPAFLQVRLCR